MNATGYSSYSPSNNGSDTAVNQFNAIISGVASTLSGDGLNVQYVDVNSYYNLSTDVDTDNVHPNDSGHQHIADAFIAALNTSTLTQGFVYIGTDSTSNGNGLTPATGATVVNGQVDGALNTDGSATGYANKTGTTGLNITNNFTVEGWVKLANLTQTSKFLSCYGLDAGSYNGWDTIWGYSVNNIEFYSVGFTGTNPELIAG